MKIIPLFIALLLVAANLHADPPVFEQRTFDLQDGSWTYRVLQLPNAYLETSHESYPLYGVEVTNNTTRPLVCFGVLHFLTESRRFFIHESSHVATLMPGATIPLLSNSEMEMGKPVFGSASCEPFAVPKLSIGPNHCGVTVPPRRPMGFDYTDYPASARRSLVSDVVTVQFVLPEPETKTQTYLRPIDAKVIDSRNFKSLDEAAVKLVSRMRLQTNCPGEAYRIRIEFRAKPCWRCATGGELIVVTLAGDDPSLTK